MNISQQLRGRKSIFKNAIHAIEKGSLAPEDQFKGSLEMKQMLCSNEYSIYTHLTLVQQLYMNKLETATRTTSFQANDARTDPSLQR
jgi:hypothetical protein